MSAIRKILGVAVVAFALLASMLLPAGATSAPGDSSAAASGRYYGAIALSRADGAVGWSHDFRTKKRAKPNGRCANVRRPPTHRCARSHGCATGASRWRFGGIQRHDRPLQVGRRRATSALRTSAP